MITSAMERFSQFLGLPASSSIWGSIFDAAFSIVATAMPILKLTNVLKVAEEAVEAAKKGNEAVSKLHRAVVTANKVSERMEAIDKVRETVKKGSEMYEQHEKPDEATEALTEVQDLDPKRQALKDLIESAQKLNEIWELALDVLDERLRINLAYPSARKGTLVELAHSMLILPAPVTSGTLAA